MIKGKLTSIVDDIVENKSKREEYIGRIEVLDKVKDLFLIPQLEMVTLKQIAEFYEIPLKTAESCFRENKEEIMLDGIEKLKANKIVEKFNSLQTNESNFTRVRGGVLIDIAEGIHIMIPNVGSYCFSKRAVLRFGMLLRYSKVAQEVRTQLLNITNN